MVQNGNWLGRFRRNLRRWYAKHARDLPWRQTTDPYRVWISEIMLQQTTVTVVVGYFDRFIHRFPTLEQLAAASEDEVLRHWEGLGYYTRARNIHKSARRIVEENGGRFPQNVAGLIKLPGIGRYTAGAIASFAFDVRAPILETNTLRLYTRLMGYRDNPRSSAGQRTLWEFADRILPRHSPGRFNSALMELGSALCTVKHPRCPECPVRSCCRALADGAQGEIPILPPRSPITAVTEAAIAIRKDGAFLLDRRGDKQRWAGLWDFPRFPLTDRMVSKLPTETKRRKQKTRTQQTNVSRELRRSLQTNILTETGIAADIVQLAIEIQHSVTRYRIRLLCFLAEYRSGSFAEARESSWVRPADFGYYPLSVTGRKLAELLTETDPRAATIERV